MSESNLPAAEPAPDWERIAASPEFRRLIQLKRRFIVRATLFFILYYFTLPILVGYVPYLMDLRVVGSLNIAYVFALSQFLMAWLLAWMYVRASARFDRISRDLIAKLEPNH